MQSRREQLLTHPALVPVAGNYDRKPRTLDRDVTTVGRARGSDLCLEANEISTLHCIIYRTVDGYRIRDCNSRTGTRLNGDAVKNYVLHDGDIINLGPFSFEFRVPAALFPGDGVRLDPVKVAHWKDSRRKLGLHALKLRQRVRETHLGSTVREQELNQKAHVLKEKIRSYDHRSGELEAAERELTDEREKLAKEKETHRNHVQAVEKDLADRLHQADQDIHKKWQEFQQRCQVEESRLLTLSQSAPPLAERMEGLNGALHSSQTPPELELLQKSMLELEVRLSHQQQQLHSECQEFLAMKDQWVKDQTKSSLSIEEQKAALDQQETLVRTQKAELMRMMGDLKKMQEDLRKQAKPDVRALQTENEQLHREVVALQAKIQREDNSIEVESILAENEKLRHLVHELETAHVTLGSSAGNSSNETEDLRAEVELLQEELRAREQQIESLRSDSRPVSDDLTARHEDLQKMQSENELLKKLLEQKSQAASEQATTAPKVKSENDLERYETELNDYRRQLETDRNKLNKEVETLRDRNKELDEAIREMEMEMSKERAELARERMRLERVRDEIKGDMERLQREIAVRDSMAPVQKLRDELTGKQPQVPGKPVDKALNDRLRSFRNQLTDSPS